MFNYKKEIMLLIKFEIATITNDCRQSLITSFRLNFLFAFSFEIIPKWSQCNKILKETLINLF